MQKQSAQNTVYSREQYGKAQFWDQRYHETGGYFDWYAQFPQLQYAFQNQYGMKHSDSILMVGCGNSQLSQQMFEAGYTNVVNIDISPSVIKQMQEVSPKMVWQVMDATKMTYQDHTFDYIIDKGTMDALIAGKDLTLSVRMIKECMRVTKQQGQVILITYGSPQGRRKVFEAALPLNKYDYYFAYINLNDMSTMINLMRTNLGGKPMNQILQQKQALAQSMKEFMMVKLMRNRRSKDKQFVVWTDYDKKTQVQIQQPEKPVADPKQVKQTKQEKQVNPKQEVPKQQKSQTQQAKTQVKNSQKKQQPKFTYKPKKQSYVYAYSIKRKFAYDFKEVLQSHDKVQKDKILEDLSQRKQIQGDQTYQKINIIANEQQVKQSIVESILYLQNKKIAHSKVLLNHANNNDFANVRIIEADKNRITLLKKTNITIKFKFTDLAKIINIFTHLCSLILDKGGIQIHPCPKTYALFVMLKSRMAKKTSNQLLKQYWYPTYRLNQIDFNDKIGEATISIPPLLSALTQKIKEIIQQASSKYYKINEFKITNINHGFVSFPQLKLLGLLTMTGLSYNQGKKYEICLQQFWSGKQEEPITCSSQIYNVNNPKVEIIKDQLTITLANLFALY